MVGNLTVRISVIDGATDVESVVATHTLSVREAARVVPGGEGGPAPSTHYIGYHHGLLEGVLWRSGPGTNHVYYPGVRGSYDRPSWILGFGAVGPSSFNAVLRCRVDGTPFEIVDRQWGRNDEVAVRSTGWISRGLGSRYTTGTSGATTDDELIFRRYSVELPLSYGDGAVTVANRPGNWECELRNTGRTFRTFRFVVGADGQIAPHAEQTAGNLYVGPPGLAVLVEMGIPADGGGFDLATSPPDTVTGFWGRAWTSDAMRALAASVPAIDTAYLPAPTRGAAGRAAAPAAGRRRR